MMRMIKDVSLAEITRQVIACKRAREEDPQYDDLEDYLEKMGAVVCACDENSTKITPQETLRWQRAGGFGL